MNLLVIVTKKVGPILLNQIGAMLDTNIMIDLLRVQWRRDKGIALTEDLKKSDFIGKNAGALYNRYVSTHGFLELRDKIEQFVYHKKIGEFGFLSYEFKEARKDVPLEKDDLMRIDSGVMQLFSPSMVKDPTLDVDKLEEVCRKGITLLDAILLLQANDIKDCDYFVTKDKILFETICRNKLNKTFFNSVKIKLRNDFFGIIKRMAKN